MQYKIIYFDVYVVGCKLFLSAYFVILYCRVGFVQFSLMFLY